MTRQTTTHTLSPVWAQSHVARGMLQRKCACGNHNATGECEECAQRRVARAPASRAPVTNVPSIVHDVLGSAGSPLDAATRASMEPRFGRDFSGVRVHADARAAESARRVNALAYTVGRDVVFGAGRYAPHSPEGQRLIAHELTHVVQQGGRGSTGNLVVGDADSDLEREAERVGSQQLAPASVGAASLQNRILQRDLATPEPETPQAAQPDLTDDEIREAIRFNRQFYDPANTRLIQDILGGPVTGQWTADNIRAIAATQEQFGLKKDGKVGPDTFRFIVNEQRLEGLPTTTRHCLTAFRVIVHPVQAGMTAGPGGTTRIRGHHVVEARFSSRCNCSQFQYRQFIAGVATATRGAASQDLAPLFPHLPGGQLPVVEQEDGKSQCAAVNYGHRNQPGQAVTTTTCPQDRYTDDAGTVNQASGCVYRAEDFPQITVTGLNTGDTVDLLVQFRGEIQRNGTTIQTKRWTTIDQSLTT